jgi:glutaredoxin
MTHTFNKKLRSIKTRSRRKSIKTSRKRRSNSRNIKMSRRRRSIKMSRRRRSIKMSRRRSIKMSRRRRNNKNDRPNFKFDVKNKVSNDRFKFKSKIYEPLIIYTKDGCPACIKVKKMCNEKGIKFKTFNRLDYEDKVIKNSNNYKYVPAIFDSRGVFIGGTPELEKLIS